MCNGFWIAGKIDKNLTDEQKFLHKIANEILLWLNLDEVQIEKGGLKIVFIFLPNPW